MRTGMSGHAGRLIECLDYALKAGSVDVILVAHNFGQDPKFYQKFTRSFDFVARQPDLPRALVTAVGGSGATRNSRLRVGQPRTGAAGIRRTTREIMQLPQAHQPTHAVPKLGIHPKLQPNPNAPAHASDKSIAAAIATSPKLAVGTSFTGATLAEEQLGAGGFVPPDSMGAVGPTQFLVGVNGKIKVLSKTGTVGQLNTDLNTFFSSVMTPPPAGGDTETTDPRVRYDTLSGKWFVTCHRRELRLAPETSRGATDS